MSVTTCKLCGKPCEPWQVFCGAACCARYEAGARPSEAASPAPIGKAAMQAEAARNSEAGAGGVASGGLSDADLEEIVIFASTSIWEPKVTEQYLVRALTNLGKVLGEVDRLRAQVARLRLAIIDALEGCVGMPCSVPLHAALAETPTKEGK